MEDEEGPEEEEEDDEPLQYQEDEAKRFDLQYYKVLVEIWKQIDRSTWIGFNIFLIFEGALLVALGEMLFAGDIDLALRLLIVATLAALALIITGYMQLLLYRRRESMKLLHHQARVLERSMVHAAEGKEEASYFPMFFLTHRAVFAGTRSRDGAKLLAEKRRKQLEENKGETLETRLRDFNFLDPDDMTVLRDEPEEKGMERRLGRLHPLATRSESSIMVRAVPRALFVFWMAVLSVSLGTAVGLLFEPSLQTVSPYVVAIVVGAATFLMSFAMLRTNLTGRIE